MQSNINIDVVSMLNDKRFLESGSKLLVQLNSMDSELKFAAILSLLNNILSNNKNGMPMDESIIRAFEQVAT
ncbi:MAG: hypothetical protein FWG30_07580 [Eubacteriaceae bacterium]|nr:hypothetical protein [Eubacteriaceae bacterium]